MSDAKKNEKLAKDLYKWCINHNMWSDCGIYFNGKLWASRDRWNVHEGKKIGEKLYEFEDIDPRNHIEYCNPDTVTMSFDGSMLYDMLNDSYFLPKTYDSFGKLFHKHGYYYELGDSWNLTTDEE